MYSKTMIGCVCVLIAMSGCTRNRTLTNENKVNVLPTQNELAHANYGKPITTAEFEDGVRATLKDPYSAHISCATPEKGWYDLSTRRIYSYISICKVNAKNGFGAYGGEDVAVYEKSITANGEVIRKDEYLTFTMLGGENKLHIVK